MSEFYDRYITRGIERTWFCAICDGDGVVKVDHYSSNQSTATRICAACKGSGKTGNVPPPPKPTGPNPFISR